MSLAAFHVGSEGVPSARTGARGHVRPRSHRRCWSSWLDLGERWPSRLVAKAAENRLSFRRKAHTSFGAANDCRNSSDLWPGGLLSGGTGL